MAITFGGQVDNTSFGSGSSQTTAFAISGTDTILWVGVLAQKGSNTDYVTGVTYNGVSMTQLGQVANNANVRIYLYYLINPASGTNNIIVSCSASMDYIETIATYYNGANQTGVPDASVSTGPNTSTSITTTLTTIADNCWLVGMYRNEFGNFTAGSNTTIRNSTSSQVMADSNSAQTPAGSKSMTLTFGGSVSVSGIMASFAPSIASVLGKNTFAFQAVNRSNTY